MEHSSFSALLVSGQPDGTFRREIRRQSVSGLPPGDLLVRVSYSSLNFKDALAATGRHGVARGYPLTPGIDAADYTAKWTGSIRAPATGKFIFMVQNHGFVNVKLDGKNIISSWANPNDALFAQ